MNILILGGTADARELARRLVALSHEVTTSLAGRTADPILPPGTVRIGGFGGAEGLAAYLQAAQIEQLIDATHPYAGRISGNASVAAAQTGIPLLRLLRAPWPEPAAANWRHVDSYEQAAAALPPGARVLLSTGHSGLEHFLARNDCFFLLRLIQPPDGAVPAHARLLVTRPPFSLADERNLMQRETITHLVTKNSGGGQTAAKLDAARQLGIQTIMITRPHYAPAAEADSVEAALAALGLG